MTEVLLFSPGNDGPDQHQVILTVLDIAILVFALTIRNVYERIELISQKRKISVIVLGH